MLDSTLQFLEELVTAVPSLAIELEGRTQGPVARALALITDVRRQATRLRVRKFWGPLALQATPVFLRASGRGPSVLDQMSAIWRGSPKPDWLEIVSPFWSEPDSTGHDPVVSAHLDHFIRGARERTVHVFVPGKADGRGRWLVSAPGSIRKSVSDAGRATLRVSAIPDLVDGDRRPLHAKVVKWTSVTNGGARQSLALIGSSNATLGGLGLGRAPRNVEAGVVYRWTGGRSTFDVLEALLPSHAEEVENARFRVDPLGVDDEEDGRVPLPGFFQWAILAVEGDGTPDQRRATVDLGLGGDDEPGSWSATLEGTVHKFDSEAHRAEGRPAFIRWSLKSDEVVLVRCVRILWRTSDGAMGDAFLPVNAMDRSKCAGDEAWRALTLDALLDALAKGTPLHRAWRRKRRAGGRGAAGGSAPQLDPHRRVDTSQFLLPRMRRISGALEGLENRLAAPVSSSEALAYRLSGPLGPISLGRMLVQSVEDPAERTFLVAELRLVVASARDRVRSLGPSLSGVRRAFDSSIAAVSALDPAVGPPPAFLARYLESVRKRTRSRGSR